MTLRVTKRLSVTPRPTLRPSLSPVPPPGCGTRRRRQSPDPPRSHRVSGPPLPTAAYRRPWRARSVHGPCICPPLRLGAALALPLQQQVTLEGCNGAQHGQHQLAGRAPCVVDPLAAHRKHDQGDAALLQVSHNVQQVAGRACQAVRLRHYQHVTLANQFELGASGNRGHLLGKDFLAAGSFQIAPLCGEASRLLDSVCSGISSQHRVFYRMCSYHCDRNGTNISKRNLCARETGRIQA
jgi:hypothetical protein